MMYRHTLEQAGLVVVKSARWDHAVRYGVVGKDGCSISSNALAHKDVDNHSSKHQYMRVNKSTQVCDSFSYIHDVHDRYQYASLAPQIPAVSSPTRGLRSSQAAFPVTTALWQFKHSLRVDIFPWLLFSFQVVVCFIRSSWHSWYLTSQFVRL